jgi:hypothetical protein
LNFYYDFADFISKAVRSLLSGILWQNLGLSLGKEVIIKCYYSIIIRLTVEGMQVAKQREADRVFMHLEVAVERPDSPPLSPLCQRGKSVSGWEDSGLAS